MTGRNIARYIRVNQLEQPLKERLDNGTLLLVAAVDLSYLSVKEQETVSELAGQGKIKLDANMAKCLKGMAGEVTEKRVLEHVGSRKEKKATAGRSIKLSADVYEKYFADIKTGEYDVTVQSKNTGHFWYIHNSKFPGKDACVIFHKHRASHPYHRHGKARNLLNGGR